MARGRVGTDGGYRSGNGLQTEHFNPKTVDWGGMPAEAARWKKKGVSWEAAGAARTCSWGSKAIFPHFPHDLGIRVDNERFAMGMSIPILGRQIPMTGIFG
jgi:hypothetical protein